MDKLDLKGCVKGGIIGIGISLSFSLSFAGLSKYNLWSWVIMILFGFLVGFFITLFNFHVEVLLYKLKPDFNGNIFFRLSIGFIVSFIVFYILGYLFLIILFEAMPVKFLYYTSLGVGVASIMIHMFFIYTEEQEEKIILERENRKLAIVEERNRIARELHDSVSQNLFGISLSLNTLPHIMEEDGDKAKEMIEDLQKMIQEIQSEMRLMIYELRPLALQEKGFLEAIESLVDLFRTRNSLDIYCNITGDEERLDSRNQLIFYRILQESLNNIVKHARASKVRVGVKIGADNTELVISDNGKGFILTEVDQENHFGIKGMKERIESVGGILKIDSQPGKGTTISANIKI